MAYGGWKHYSGLLTPASDPYANDVGLAEVLNGLMAVLTQDPDWSVKKAATKHFTNDRSYHGICQHTSGAEIAFVWNGKIDASGFWNAANHRDNTAGSFVWDRTLAVAYHAAGTGTFDDLTTPNDVAWSSNPGLMSKLFTMLYQQANPSSSSPDEVSFMVRGADLIFCYSVDRDLATKVDACVMYGDLLESPLQHDPNDTELYCAVLMSFGNVSSLGTPVFDFLNAAGDTMLSGSLHDLSVYIDRTYVAPPPYNKLQYQLYAPLSGGAVYGTDGVKGLVSDEVAFITASDAAYPKRTWLGDGVNPTHVHIGHGVWVGWDSSNSQWD